jgi:hypothetical protein
VAPSTLDELQAYAAAVGGAQHDEYSQQSLARAVAEYAPQRRESVAVFALTVDGRPYPSVLAALTDPSATFQRLELVLTDPPRDPRAWEWITPFERLEFAPDGSADIVPFARRGPPRRAIVRVLLRQHYIPRTRSSFDGGRREHVGVGPPMALDPIAPAAAFAREHHVLPFSLAILLYTAEERYRLELDLIDNTLQKDPRSGRLGLDRRVRRSSRISFAIDTTLARGDLPLTIARALEILSETHGLTALEMGNILGGVREMGSSALQGLTARGLATYDKRTGTYRPRFDPFGAGALPAAPADRVGPMPNAALRTSVMELQAAADSRATCPLCGDALPPGLRSILCPRCEQEVNAASPS